MGNEYHGMQENYQGFVPRADFKPESFDTLIQQKGYSVIWEQGMFCSCVDSQSGQPDYNCPSCRGKGYLYFGPTQTKALVTSISGHKEQERIGLQDMGSAYLTPLSGDNVGFRDRFTFVDFRIKYSEVVVRGASGTPDITRYPIDQIIGLRVLGTVYKEGIDFIKLQNGTGITWPTNSIVTNTQFSILYTTPPVYIAINPVHELRGTYTKAKSGGLEAFVHLPKQFQIKREDFLENEH